ncbi:hypothetical protein [Streptomyces albogriseolus]|uniref:hypothetical protein n=1 Tax=Streptomyces albogriseolus TaxID=1887 RepID=UPI0033A7B71C
MRTTTLPSPWGRLGVQGALSTGDAGQAVRDLPTALRNDGCGSVRERFERAVAEGDLPSGAGPDLLAPCVTTLACGIAVQAASGIGREELQAMADGAPRTWPLT